MSTSSKTKQQQEVLSDEELIEQARDLLHRNMISGERAGFNYHFTKPSPETYPFQYFWDTCFHVFTLVALGEVDMAKKHMQSLFEMQLHDGFVGHMNYWKRLWPGRVTDLLQLRPKDILHLYKPHMSALVQPPLAAQAVWCIYKADKDIAFVKEMLPKLKKYYKWLAANRDFEGKGLLSIISPFESGMDWKASYDPVLGYKGKAGPLLFWKVLQVDAFNFSKNYNLPKIYNSNRFIVKDVGFNTIYAQNLVALSELCAVVADSEERHFKEQAGLTENSILQFMYDKQDAAFYDLYGHHYKKLKVRTGTIFFPVVLKSVPKEICQQVLDRHLLHKDGFHVPFPVPSLATNEPAFNPDESVYIWRGPTWVLFNWFIQAHLLEKDYTEEASKLLQSIKQLISKSGFREYYNPFTGEGNGAQDFTWSGLVVDMIKRQQEQEDKPLKQD
ncbi:amylo-alpha-1,6-glucosidase [Pontibacter cellulosilyticus]|uniref:Trehalase-like protein n=1 Tax=Pontibacter cellulosilyticus TaxID=1720253 RepID=A0A923SHM4_9BACT|nr:trehalase-like protein [Pontibacter cellulosilyticus]MBC5991899.1 trehalase-like protein [Pontibacter cellulosilyticus]